MFVKTEPRPLVAEFVRIGDYIAVYPVPSKHEPAEPCDCPPAEGEGGKRKRHCSTRHLPVRSTEFLAHNREAVLWCRVINAKPAPKASLWFGTPRVRLTVVPFEKDGYPGYPLANYIADQRDPMVVCERVRVPDAGSPADEYAQREGQPETVGITRAPLRLVRTSDEIKSDATVVLASSLVPVGVQVVPLGEGSHQDTSAMLDFKSERESD